MSKKKSPPKEAEESREIANPPSPRDQVITWLLEGHRDSDIAEAIKTKWPDTDQQQLILSAVEHFENASRCDLSVVVGWGMEAYKDLYRRMIAIGDFASAMKAVKELVALAGKHCVRDNEESSREDDESQPA